MRIVVGADHRGYQLKDTLADTIRNSGHEVLDVGTNGPESVDYPDIALALGDAILDGRAERGILVCGSGVGAAIAAKQARRHSRQRFVTTPIRPTRVWSTTI